MSESVNVPETKGVASAVLLVVVDDPSKAEIVEGAVFELGFAGLVRGHGETTAPDGNYEPILDFYRSEGSAESLRICAFYDLLIPGQHPLSHDLFFYHRQVEDSPTIRGIREALTKAIEQKVIVSFELVLMPTELEEKREALIREAIMTSARAMEADVATAQALVDKILERLKS